MWEICTYFGSYGSCLIHRIILILEDAVRDHIKILPQIFDPPAQQEIPPITWKTKK